MKSDNVYFLVSFTCHVLLATGIFVFIHVNNSFNEKYFTIANKGAALSVNIVNNVSTPNKPIVHPQKKTKEIKKNIENYPKDDKAKISLAKEKQHNKDNNLSKIIQKTQGSGGKHGKNSEVIPVVKNNNLINYIAPEYPKRALMLGEEGTVVVRLLVNKEGEIVVNKLYKSSGHKLLDNAVIKVAKLWSTNNPPVETSWVEIVVNFIIR